jgi:hypothetical protein
MAKGAWTLGEFPLPLVRVPAPSATGQGSTVRPRCWSATAPTSRCPCGMNWRSARVGISSVWSSFLIGASPWGQVKNLQKQKAAAAY